MENKLEEFIKNPKKSMFILALPVMVAMLVETAYNIVDTIFVGRLGAEAIAALTFAFPLFFILIAITAGLSIGMGYGAPGFIINLVRTMVVAVPLAYVFVYTLGYGYLSVAVAMVIGGIVASIISMIWLNSKLKKVENIKIKEEIAG